MKRLVRLLVSVSMVAALFAMPAAAQAAAYPITQSPDTTGMVYAAGSWLAVSWACDETIPDYADIKLMISSEVEGALYSYPVATGLPLVGGTEVQIPSEGGPYFYHIYAYWEDAEGMDYDVSSDAFWAWVWGNPWWFTIGTAPTVWAQPENQTVAVGDMATFSAAADGTPMPTVQWQLDSGSGWMDIDGAVEDSYTTPDATAAMNGWRYRAVFTNECGSIESDPALLTVEVPQVAVSISAPTVTPAVPKPKRDAAFTATVSPPEAAQTAGLTLHLFHWETRRVDGKRVAGWYEYPGVILSTVNASTGLIGGVGKLPVRGEWKMYVTSPASTAYQAGLSPVTYFTAK